MRLILPSFVSMILAATSLAQNLKAPDELYEELFHDVCRGGGFGDHAGVMCFGRPLRS